MTTSLKSSFCKKEIKSTKSCGKYLRKEKAFVPKPSRIRSYTTIPLLYLSEAGKQALAPSASTQGRSGKNPHQNCGSNVGGKFSGEEYFTFSRGTFSLAQHLLEIAGGETTLPPPSPLLFFDGDLLQLWGHIKCMRVKCGERECVFHGRRKGSR